MKPPRLPGTEKFRFCDKKFEQRAVTEFSLNCNDQSDLQILTQNNSILVKNDFLYTLSHSLSTESISCSFSDESSLKSKSKTLDSVSTSSTLEELISQSNLQPVRCEHNKRKPNLPISSRLTSRVFTLTTYIGQLSDRPSGTYHSTKSKPIYETFTCPNLSRSPTPSSLGSSSEAGIDTLPTKILDANCRLHPSTHLCLGTSQRTGMNLMTSSTSHASLMSDESSTSVVSTPPTDFDDSLRSSSCSPVEHWAKHAPNQNRLSTSSHSSWEDGSDLHEVT